MKNQFRQQTQAEEIINGVKKAAAAFLVALFFAALFLFILLNLPYYQN